MTGMIQSMTTGRDGAPDGAKTWFSIAAAIVLIKFLLGGAEMFGMSFGDFDSQGGSMLIAAFGGVYWGRSNTKSKEGTGNGSA